jgi:hypothetical protein
MQQIINHPLFTQNSISALINKQFLPIELHRYSTSQKHLLQLRYIFTSASSLTNPSLARVECMGQQVRGMWRWSAIHTTELDCIGITHSTKPRLIERS